MGEGILKILFEMKEEKAIVIVTHDKEIAKKADTVVEIRDGRLV